jgi:ABC-type dipeptide/oligopeptide/nickel transport system ATPase component
MNKQNNHPLLEVNNLKTDFFTEDGVVKAVDGVDFTVYPGEVMDGEVFFEGRDMLKLSEAEMIDLRGSRISMIFQQPQSSLNPVFKVGDQVAEVLQIHQNMGREESWEKAVGLFRLVGFTRATKKVDIQRTCEQLRSVRSPDHMIT